MFDARWPSLVVLAVLILSGYGWLACFRARALSGPERLGVAFACGGAWLGLLAAVLGPFELFIPAIIIPLQLAPLAGFFVGRATAEEPDEPSSPSRAWLGFLPVIPLVVLSFWFAAQRPVWSIDAQRRWVLKAQWMADEHTPVPERMAEVEWAHAHPSYPPLISAICAQALQLGSDRDEGMRLMFPSFLFALLAVIYGYVRRRAPPLIATGLTLLLATAPCFSVLDAKKGSYGLGADSVLADIPLALFLTSLSVFVLEAIGSSGRIAKTYWSLATLIGIGAVLTKNEGLLFAPVTLAIALGLAFFVKRESPLGRARRPMLVVFAILTSTSLFWKWIARNMAVRAGEEYLSAGVFEELSSGARRTARIFDRIVDSLADQGLWGVLWIWPLIWLVWFAIRFLKMDAEQRVRRVLPFLWLSAGLAMVFGAYVATGWKQGSWSKLMNVSLARLLIHHAPLALILACDLFTTDVKEKPTTSDETSYLDAESAIG